MKSGMTRGLRRGLLLLAGGTALGTSAGALAQAVQYPPGAVVQPLPPRSEITRYLSELADNPRSLSALIGAGRAALQHGDPQAALTFFARGEEVAPRDARVKAGMGSALVQMEQPQPALRFFTEAISLGAPEAEVAKDRGLAYDMMGDPRRAQQDYTSVLRRGDDAEVRQRLALSLAISGERAAALQTIDALVRRNNRAAWRTRAFVLALTGDAAGANQAAQATMPAGQAQAMAPFLSQLAALNPSQKAAAVHFGRFPSDGRPAQVAQAVDTSAYPGAVAMSGAAGSQASGLPRRTQAQEPASTATRRRPERSNRSARSDARDPLSRARGSSSRAPGRRPSTSTAERTPAPVQQTPVRLAENRVVTPPPQARAQPVPPQPQRTQPAFGPPASSPAQAVSSSPPLRQTPVAPATQRVTPPAVRPMDLPPAQPQVSAAAPIMQQTAPPPAQQPSPAVDRPGLADIAALVQSLPATETPVRATPTPTPPPTPATQSATPARVNASPFGPPTRPPPAAQSSSTPPPPAADTTAPATRRTTTAARPAPARATPRPPASPAHPSRHWVQIAGGADKAALPRELTRLKGLAPDLLRNRAGYTTPLRATNRLLVGPFETVSAAQEFVNQLGRLNISAFSWTSPAGQEIERLAAR